MDDGDQHIPGSPSINSYGQESCRDDLEEEDEEEYEEVKGTVTPTKQRQTIFKFVVNTIKQCHTLGQYNIIIFFSYCSLCVIMLFVLI